jgi:C1A family cysteine protease
MANKFLEKNKERFEEKNASVQNKIFVPIELFQKRADDIIRLNLAETVPMLLKAVKLPVSFSLAPYNSTIYDQGNLGSCTANALSTAYRIQYKIRNSVDYHASRLAIYYYERQIINTIDQDSGAYVTDGLKYIKDNGICSETTWPYVISRFKLQPGRSRNLVEENSHKLTSYSIIPVNSNAITAIKIVLNTNKPVLLAVAIYSSFVTSSVARRGIVPVPNTRRESLLGGHEMTIVEYNDKTNLFTVVNSWGSLWAANGSCFIPYSYISNRNLTYELAYLTL